MSQPPTYPFALPELAFKYDALAPHIDAKTMEIHHSKHHQGYVDKVNAALKDHSSLHNMSIEDILRNFEKVPDAIKTSVRNNGGGHANHQFFWKILRPNGSEGAGGKPSGELAKAIDSEFGSLENLKKAFNDAGSARFGSGWVFLLADPKTLKLKVHTTPNQDSVLMEGAGYGLMCCDVWEHAYYLSYQNRRPDYLKAFWNVVAWDVVSKRFEGIKAGKHHL